MSPCLYCYSCLLCTAAAKVPGRLYEREALSCLFCWHQWSCKVLKAKGQSWTHIYTRARLSVKTFQLRQGEEACEDRKSKVVYCVVLFVSGFFFCLFSFIQGQKEEPLKWEWVGKKEEADQQTETVKDTDSQRGWKTDAEKENIPCSLSSHVHEENTSRQL